MEPSSFDIAFPEHGLPKGVDYWFNWSRSKGATLEPISVYRYRIVCTRPGQLSWVGWALYHSSLASLCEVIAVSGNAHKRASLYKEHP
ncbi:hypothetical protein C7S18_06095 [Ahniella affigens]|uniref:Uncharacterized protein n=1 Tax=Ahniella affigens TaxID=2021234 RepID=A0A2P1PPM8_9GAMM|nr:hypothetical protein [Ahniella affigens]AVP96796.1 hypothetical protein C7S18_06095 [Ahniella affigens]